MKTAISIPDDLFRAAEKAARRLGLNRSEFYRRALASFLARHEDALVTQALDEVYGEAGKKARVDPLLDELQRASLPREDW